MMMTRVSFKLYFICLFVVALCFTSCNKSPKPNLQGIVYSVGNGFGYKITINGKLYINQTSIPALPGKLQFCDSTDARSVCNKVLEKMNEGKNPFVTPEELKQLNIKTKC
nr:DUF4907 domain-containing protein [uncultured Flavobacterium sp.]